MKRLALLFLISFISFSFVAQAEKPFYPVKLNNTEWRLSGRCLESVEQSEFSIYTIQHSNDISHRWGYFITFSDRTFSTNYRARCGVDCFTSVSGTYEWRSDDTIEFFVETIQRNGYCQKESEAPRKSFGVFRISSSEKGFLLTRL